MGRREKVFGEKEKSPAFQFYVKEFLSDANQAGMSLQETGAYARLMCFEWNEQGKGLPDDPLRCARMVGASPAAMRKMWPALRSCFESHPETAGRLIHPRLQIERLKQAAFKRRQEDNGRLGGRPVKPVQDAADQKPTENPDVTHGYPNANPSGPNGTPKSEPKITSPISHLRSASSEREKNTASVSDAGRDPFTDPAITARAGRFVERYQALYPVHRHGARCVSRPATDYQAAVELCSTWDDDARLERLAVCFLTTDHKFAAEGSRTLPQFRALASWCDGELATWEARRA